MKNKTAIEHINSIMANYSANVIQVANTNPDYRQCAIWLSLADIEALQMAIEALKGEQK